MEGGGVNYLATMANWLPFVPEHGSSGSAPCFQTHRVQQARYRAHDDGHDAGNRRKARRVDLIQKGRGT